MSPLPKDSKATSNHKSRAPTLLTSADTKTETHLTTNNATTARLIVPLILLSSASSANGRHDYGDALRKSILFFQGQRSSKLPSTQSLKWRRDSALHDSSTSGVDLTGGYYDARDNVKFGFPMAITTTMLSWSIIDFGKNMGDRVSVEDDGGGGAGDNVRSGRRRVFRSLVLGEAGGHGHAQNGLVM